MEVDIVQRGGRDAYSRGPRQMLYPTPFSTTSHEATRAIVVAERAEVCGDHATFLEMSASK